jgi:CPA1 family monovalent cation:H+ antiporter
MGHASFPLIGDATIAPFMAGPSQSVMLVFETVLALLFGATILSVVARRANIPYPTLLALGGSLLAFLPGAPRLDLPPDLILALFVAPVLLDAAYDTSRRDLRQNWRPILSLVLVAVGVTTIAVAFAARLLLPDFPWPAAVALGALLAPPDAVAAVTILRHVNPPHRIRAVLEGESLLNDATALLIYKLAIGAFAAGSFSVPQAIPTFVIVVLGSVAAGWLLAWPVVRVTERSADAPTAVILQFVATFGLWLLAERLGLSAVVTVVVFGLTAARYATLAVPAHLRVPSFAIWESVTFVLNVLAFTFIGLQMRPIFEALNAAESLRLFLAALAILAVVIVVRLIWVMAYLMLNWMRRSSRSHTSPPPSLALTAKSGLVIGWSGMRGIVTLAAAMALPPDFPYRDFIQLTSFVVVLGTLVIQGLTLRPLLVLLRLPKDPTVEAELSRARSTALKAALAELENHDTAAAQRLTLEFRASLTQAGQGRDPPDSSDNVLRRKVLLSARRAIDDLRSAGHIGDGAFRLVEAELDWLELPVLLKHR